MGHTGRVQGRCRPWAIQAGFRDLGPYRQGSGTLGHTGRVQGPWAIEAGFRDSGPWRQGSGTLGHRGRFQGPWAIEAGFRDLGPHRQGSGTLALGLGHTGRVQGNWGRDSYGNQLFNTHRNHARPPSRTRTTTVLKVHGRLRV